MIRAQLIELTPDRAVSTRKRRSLNMAFTSAWQSSKLPSTATAWTFEAPAVVIWRRCTGDTRPCGNRMNRSQRGEPAKAAIAAPPVSPEVAPTIVARAPRSARTWSISRARSCIATSLKASVGPWKSSSTKSLAPSCTSGATGPPWRRRRRGGPAARAFGRPSARATRLERRGHRRRRGRRAGRRRIPEPAPRPANSRISRRCPLRIRPGSRPASGAARDLVAFCPGGLL